ncbi:uncharacterized protein LACBIDRAFT_334462 [Laccaria bicolor S238N-H82]|uniref:Predicted protein n=1 Tax=Laccaria bicolor (strain S238N-H82 / ATCC MYA-4686) TaxID=486041 RepID=B0DZA1_LACBS|nr:uncharacterized protein LACBIDRAFT_334462 [Laccaria bicolor S238N-H82]EDR00054.1 predicted protein [Laccaria bicolor S238N-H82]|eukprot:XP_001889260.1 predicted protein [Laccaria bicolor S238N-H82]
MAAEEDAAENNMSLQNFIYATWMQICREEAARPPEKMIWWIRNHEGVSVPDNFPLNILYSAYEQIFACLKQKLQEIFMSDFPVHILTRFFTLKNNYQFGHELNRQGGTHVDPAIRKLLTYLLTREVSFKSDGKLIMTRVPKDEAHEFMKRFAPHMSKLEAFSETIIDTYRLETFRSTVGSISVTASQQLQCYFVTKCNFPTKPPTPGEKTDIPAVLDLSFLKISHWVQDGWNVKVLSQRSVKLVPFLVLSALLGAQVCWFWEAMRFFKKRHMPKLTFSAQIVAGFSYTTSVIVLARHICS